MRRPPVNAETLRCHLRRIEPPRDLLALRRAVAAHDHGVMLESIAGGRFSCYATAPVRIAATTWDDAVDPFMLLADYARPWATLNDAPALPFAGGWIGFFGYECGRFVEPTGSWWRSWQPFPLAQWGLYDTVLIHDKARDEWIIAALDLPARLHAWPRPPARERLLAMEAFVRGAPDTAEAALPMHEPAAAGAWDWTEAEYCRRAERAIERIRAGDVFQVNLTHRFAAQISEPAVDLYDRLCRTNPAAYAAFLSVARPSRSMGARGAEDSASRDGPGAILSSSPELLVELRGDQVVTRPIKGTRPRTGMSARDAAARRELAASPKERAELNMIVDLERNDLGRVCRFGSVRVVHEGEIEAHPTVFHRTATVAGQLRPDCDAFDLLRAVFPGGSVTGAPKVQATKIIAELEDRPRGPYCGAIGWIGVNGDMCLNLAIRTMTVCAGEAALQAGGGIVADSDPAAEYRETMAKAAGMMAALGAAAQAPAAAEFQLAHAGTP